MAQVTPPAAESAATEAVDTATKSQPGLFDGMFMYLPLIIGVMFLYMLLLGKPQNKDNRKASELLANLKKNDRVVTAGGIIGTVVNFGQEAEHITLRIDDSSGTKLQVLKQSIVRVISDEK